MKVDKSPKISLLKHPYPYKAMLSISSDCDGMSLKTFENLHLFLNTKEETKYGEGLGLDISDSMWVYAPVNRKMPLRERVLSLKAGLLPSDPNDMADTLAYYVNAGWIDTLHSLGDFSHAHALGCFPTRKHIDESLNLFAKYNVFLPVWVNHGNKHNLQNISFKKKFMGLRPESELFAFPYVRDLGVMFVNINVYNGVELCLRDIENYEVHPYSIHSFSRYYKTYKKSGEVLDGVLKHTIDKKNGGWINHIWHPSALHHQINPDNLDWIIAESGFAIFAQHLGYKVDIDKGYPEKAISAFRLLKEYQDAQKILVARTSRLLHYLRVKKHIEFTTEQLNDVLIIRLELIRDQVTGVTLPTLDDARGLTFSVKDWGGRIEILLGEKHLPDTVLIRKQVGKDALIVGIQWHDPDTFEYHKFAPSINC